MKTKRALTVLSVLLISLSLFAQGTTETKEAVLEYTSDANPKYIFMFIGDGMSSPQTNAAQVFGGVNEPGRIELDKLTFTQFPVVGIQYTQDSTSFCPDSASTATSLSSGFKTHSGVIGMGVDRVTKGVTIAEKLRDQKDFKIGIVSTVTLNHATPAAYYAHIASRNDYYEIGLQMAESGFDYFAGGSLLSADEGDKSLYEVLQDNGVRRGAYRGGHPAHVRRYRDGQGKGNLAFAVGRKGLEHRCQESKHHGGSGSIAQEHREGTCHDHEPQQDELGFRPERLQHHPRQHHVEPAFRRRDGKYEASDEEHYYRVGEGMEYGCIFYRCPVEFRSRDIPEEPQGTVRCREEQKPHGKHGGGPCRHGLEYPHDSGEQEYGHYSFFYDGQSIHSEGLERQAP